MTHRLNPLSPLDALYACAQRYPGGMERLAERLGMKVSTLYKKLCANTTTHMLTLDEAESLVRAFQESNMPDACRALDALAFRMDRVCIPLPDPTEDAGDIAAHVCKVFQEGGDVAREVQSSIADGRIGSKERIAIENEIEQAIRALVALQVIVGREAK